MRSTADITISSVLLVLTALAGGALALMAFFMLAFTDNCPPETCHLGAAMTSIVVGTAIGGVAAVAGGALTITALVRHNRAWPFAVATLAACVGACAAGILGYIVSVGGWGIL